MMGIEWLRPAAFFGSILYALIGVLVFWLSFVIVDKLTPYDLWGELVEKRNVALAVVVVGGGCLGALRGRRGHLFELPLLRGGIGFWKGGVIRRIW